MPGGLFAPGRRPRIRPFRQGLPPGATLPPALNDDTPFRPQGARALRVPSEDSLPRLPRPFFQEDLPRARAPLMQRAPGEVWAMVPLQPISSALADPQPFAPRGTRPAFDVAPWVTVPLFFPYALADVLVPLPPVNRPAQDRSPWNFQALNPISAALADPPLFRPRGPRTPLPDLGGQDLPRLATGAAALPDASTPTPRTSRPAFDTAPWVSPPLFSPYALADGAALPLPSSRAPQDRAGWGMQALNPISSALPDPDSYRPRVPRPSQDTTPWLLAPVFFPYALADALVRLPPANRPARDLSPWNFLALQPISAALQDPLPFAPRAAPPARDLAPWLLDPLLFPYALADALVPRPRGTRAPQDVFPWVLVPLAAVTPALADPVQPRPAPNRPPQDPTPWNQQQLNSLTGPPPDTSTARAPRGPIRSPVELWLLAPLATPLALADPAPAPRSPAGPRPILPPWDMRPLAAYTPWHQADPTLGARIRARQEYGTWDLLALPINQTPNGWNTVPPPPRWVNVPPQDRAGWALPGASTAGPWRPWDPDPARRPPPPARRALEAPWTFSALVDPSFPEAFFLRPLAPPPARAGEPPWFLSARAASFLPPDGAPSPARGAPPRASEPSWFLLARGASFLSPDASPRPSRALSARTAEVPWFLRTLTISSWSQDELARAPRALRRAAGLEVPWFLRTLATSSWLPDDPLRPRGRTPLRPTAPWDLRQLVVVVLPKFTPDFVPRPRGLRRFPHEFLYQQTPAGILFPVLLRRHYRPIAVRDAPAEVLVLDAANLELALRDAPTEITSRDGRGPEVYLAVEDSTKEISVRDEDPGSIFGMPDAYAIQGATGQSLAVRMQEADGSPINITFPVSFVVRPADRSRRAVVTVADVLDARGGTVNHNWTDEELRWACTLTVQLTWIDPSTNKPRVFPRNRFITVLVGPNLQVG